MRGRLPTTSTIAALIFLSLASGCARVRVDPPAGFAPLKSRTDYHAVSPEGVIFRVRIEKNDPQKGLEFWSETLEHHLTGEGYHPSGDPAPFDTAGSSPTPGVIQNWTVLYGAETWTWITAFVVDGKRVYVAEAAGEHALMRRYRPAIEEALRSLDP